MVPGRDSCKYKGTEVGIQPEVVRERGTGVEDGQRSHRALQPMVRI